jgi:hypothetical protein
VFLVHAVRAVHDEDHVGVLVALFVDVPIAVVVDAVAGFRRIGKDPGVGIVAVGGSANPVLIAVGAGRRSRWRPGS